MNQLSQFLESGILELYVMGIASPEEIKEVEQMALLYPEIRQEIELIERGLEEYALTQAVQPKATLKPLIMASINYIERVNNGEPLIAAPLLSPTSRKEEFAFWLDNPEFELPEDFEGAYAKIINANLKATTAIIWIKEFTDNEIHHNEYEHFLILEGTCDFYIGEEVHHLVPGDYLRIPLHTPHIAKVTSEVPCKAILQRVAA